MKVIDGKFCKKCVICKEYKPFEMFDKRGKYDWVATCKECMKKYKDWKIGGKKDE